MSDIRQQNCLACLFCNPKKAGWFSSKIKLKCDKSNKTTTWNATCDKFWRVSDEVIAARYNTWDLSES